MVNFVVITIDTLRADHVGCYGYKQIRTPNVDALAADSAQPNPAPGAGFPPCAPCANPAIR